MKNMAFSKLIQRFTIKFAHLKGDAKGVAAVEFALIFPVMLGLYLGSVEISGALQANKNVGKTASTVADLITQQDEISRSEIKAISEIGEALLFPYTETRPAITVVGIQVEDKPNPKAFVAWSKRYRNGSLSTPFAVGQEINIPARLKIRNSFLVRSTTALRYKPLVTWSTESDGLIRMNETYYLRPRLSAKIDCIDC